MMKLFAMALAAFPLLLSSAIAGEEKLPKWVIDAGPQWQPPAEGVIRDAHSAKVIAYTVWTSSNSWIKKDRMPNELDWEKGMDATLTNGVWEVESKPLPPNTVGGGLFIFIAQKDARVMSMFLTQ